MKGDRNIAIADLRKMCKNRNCKSAETYLVVVPGYPKDQLRCANKSCNWFVSWVDKPEQPKKTTKRGKKSE